jgi:2-polyprenyl-6-hydroxyphenyl methylase/3-demethylubiquinone-9 3-methyltransferase
MVIHNIVNLMRQRYRSGQNPFTWNKKQARGMDTYHDLIDWLGGLPYEVCSIEEVFAFMVERGFIEKRILERGEGANNIFLFQRLVSSEKKPGIA